MQFIIDLGTQGFRVTRPVLWFVLAIVFIIFLVVSLMLEYHWLRYGRSSPRIFLAELVYFVVSVLLFGGAVAAIEAF